MKIFEIIIAFSLGLCLTITGAVVIYWYKLLGSYDTIEILMSIGMFSIGLCLLYYILFVKIAISLN